VRLTYRAYPCRRTGGPAAYTQRPPSTSRQVPVMKAASSLA
jgi:hypothetical protein